MSQESYTHAQHSRPLVKAILCIAALVAVAALSTAGNTVKGFGKDIQPDAEATEREISGD